MALRDPDAAIIPFFKTMAILNPSETHKQGREIYDDLDVVELRRAGAKDFGVYPATEFCGWVEDPITGSQRKLTYAERFPDQYRQFKANSVQTKSGTPLATVPFLTEARRAELRVFNIYTVEALAEVDGQELKTLGPGGRELKNRAIEYLEECKDKAPSTILIAELEALRARTALLEEDNKVLKEKLGSTRQVVDPDVSFENMDLDQLRRYIEVKTGHPPQGAVNRKTLIRMARNAYTESEAA